MKIRNGFVSNSSSSSFVIIAKGETIKEVLSNFSPREKKFINEVLYGKRIAVLNEQEFEVYSQTLYDDTLYNAWGDTFCSEKDKNADDWEDYIEIFDKFLKDIKSSKNTFVQENCS